VGGLAGAVGLLAVGAGRDRRPLSSWLALVYAFVVVTAALNHWAWGLPALFVLAGITMTASNASANTLLQSISPVRLRGQTISLFMLAMRGGVSLGGLLSGISMSFWGVRDALLLNGILAVVAHLLIGYAWRCAPLPR
jgi:predicted MFS family arabinose efflux permease